jgi:hypothetical protein
MGMRIEIRGVTRVLVFARFLPLPISLALALPLAVACLPAQSPTQPTISLRMSGSPSGATVIIDEEALGTLDFVAAHGVALPPGVHHITVKAEGYFPSDREVDARPGSPPVRLEIALAPVPD